MEYNALTELNGTVVSNEESSSNQTSVIEDNSTCISVNNTPKYNLDGYNQKRKKQQQKDKERGKQKPPLTALRKKQLNQVQ